MGKLQFVRIDDDSINAETNKVPIKFTEDGKPIMPIPLDVIPTLYEKQINWLKERNIKPDYSASLRSVTFWFQDVQEATLFKIRWC